MKIHFHFKKLLIINCALLITTSVFAQIDKSAEKYLLKDSVIGTGHIGISVFNPATDTYLYNYNATKNFIPSSNVKLFTLYAGMKYLGDSLVGIRYKEDSTSITIIGSGDPTFLHPDFKKQPVFDFLIANKKKLIVDRTKFASANITKYGKGWAWDDADESFMPERSIFPIYGNVARFWNKSGKLIITPSCFKATTYEVPDNLNIFKVSKPFGSNIFVIYNDSSGSKYQESPIKMGADDKIKNIETRLLADTLHKEVIFDEIIFDPSSHEKIIYSQPADSLFKIMMHRSDNFFAEQTLIMASVQKLGQMSDAVIIDLLLNSYLHDIPQKPRWVDGCGLSRYNLFTPQSFVYILHKMRTEFGWERMKTILPTGGEGTLKNYYLKDSGSIYAKTGSLTNNNALSGYITTKKGNQLIFSILVNNFQGSASSVRRSIESFIEDIIKNN